MKRKLLPLINRLFPKKVIHYLVNIVDDILNEDTEQLNLTDFERETLREYKHALVDSKDYYLKSNLVFVQTMSPVILRGEANSGVQFLYSEILRLNPQLMSQRLGNELLLKKFFK